MAKSNDVTEPRRFYARVEVADAPGGFAVRLDGKPALTPAALPLAAPARALAELIAQEWTAQGDRVRYATMPATRLAHTALDAVPGDRQAFVDAFVRLAGADLLCYFAEGPASLVARQRAAWTPLLDWAASALDLRLETTAGVIHRDQPPAALARALTLAAERPDFELAALAFAAALTGSAVLALALWSGRLDGAGAFAASQVDEAFQQSQWGLDAEAADRARRGEAEAVMLEAWFGALRD